jgi:hypothetical protein
MSERKRLTDAQAAQLLHETGLLFEINRTILHPLGLALAIAARTDAGGGETVIGFGGMTDCRYDPEGMIFNPDSDGPAKLKSFYEREGIARLRARFAALGFVVQPSPVYARHPEQVDRPDGMYLLPDENAATVNVQIHGGEEQPHHRAVRQPDHRDESPGEADVEAAALLAYDAYGDQVGWRNFAGGDMPDWADLPEKIRGAWWHAAKAILDVKAGGVLT